jgi:hypothetical protein
MLIISKQQMNKDFVRSTSEKILIGFFSFVVLVSCDTGEIKSSDPEASQISPIDDEDMLLGSWEAKWETQAEAFSINGEYKNLTMKGKVHFKENGKVKIQAYGYQGCIFMSDTMINELRYILTGDTVSLLAEDENFGLPYHIIEANHNMVKLILMDDIALTLTR